MCEKNIFQAYERCGYLAKRRFTGGYGAREKISVSQEETPLRSHVVPNRMAIAVTERKQSTVWLKDRPRWQECKMLTYRGTQYGGSTDN